MNARSTWNLLAAFSLVSGFGYANLAAQAAADSEKKDEPIKLESVEVTGSRIKRVDFEGPSPIRVISRADIDNSGRSNLTELLRELPEAGSIGINEGGTITAVRGSTALDLRGLGANNTLVIVNGRRQVLTGSNSGGTTFVDLNRFPISMIERIEVLKDGASAIYGADATSGVVNIITRKDYNGFEVIARYGNSFETDTNEKTISLLGGASNDKASINVGLTYFERAGLKAADTTFANNADLSSRFTARGGQYLLNISQGFTTYDGRSGAGPQARITLRAGQVQGVNGVNIPGLTDGTAITRLPGTGGVIPSGAGALQGTLSNASPSFTSAPATGSGGVFNQALANTYEAQRLTAGQNPSNLYNFQEFVWLVPEATRTGMVSDFSYKINDNFTAYMSLGYQNNRSHTELAPSPMSTAGDNQLFVPRTNFYNPFGVDVNLTYRTVDAGARKADIESNTYSILAGLKGTFMDRFDWDTGYTYGRDTTVDVTTNALSESRVRAALASNNPATALNVFGGANFKNSPAVLNSIKVTSQKGGSAELNLYDAKVSGPLFDIPMGEVRGAIYAEYRTENFNEANDALSTTLDDIIGQVKLADSTRAFRSVKSVAAEVGFPLIKDGQFKYLDSVQASIAARYEKFSEGYNSGVKPYYGLSIKPVKSLLLRGSYTEAFRAPSLPQLFGGVRESLPSNLPDFARPQLLTGDPFDGTSTQRLVRAGGNPNLTPETAKSFQGGFVWDVPFKLFKGLTLEATYGEIEQSNVITSTGTAFLRNNEFGDARGLITRVPGTQTFTNNTASAITVYTGPGARLSPGADVIVQPGQSITVPGQIISLSDSVVNLAFQAVRFYDFGVRYSIKTTNWGRFTANSTSTYIKNTGFTRTVGGVVTNVVDRASIPRFRLQTNIDWRMKEFGAGLTNNFIPANGDEALDLFRQSQYSTYNGYFSYEFSSKGMLAGAKVTIGMDNIMDEEPPLYNASVGYDQSLVGRPQGRFGYISVKKEF